LVTELKCSRETHPKEQTDDHSIAKYIGIRELISYYLFRNIMDGPYFVRILQNHVVPNVRRQFGAYWTLQMNDDPKHRSRMGQNFWSYEVSKVINWPEHRLTVNSVENLSSTIRQHVGELKLTNLEELIDFLCEKSNDIDIVLLSFLVNWMKTRCWALLESKGERINY